MVHFRSHCGCLKQHNYLLEIRGEEIREVEIMGSAAPLHKLQYASLNRCLYAGKEDGLIRFYPFSLERGLIFSSFHFIRTLHPVGCTNGVVASPCENVLPVTDVFEDYVAHNGMVCHLALTYDETTLVSVRIPFLPRL